MGNNDGANLSAPAQFRSKEISKSSVVDDMVAANSLLYKPVLGDPATEKAIAKGQKVRDTEHPDHCVVIKYMPAVGDSKRAIDEYYSEIMMGGHNILSLYNLCEVSPRSITVYETNYISSHRELTIFLCLISRTRSWPLHSFWI